MKYRALFSLISVLVLPYPFGLLRQSFRLRSGLDDRVVVTQCERLEPLSRLCEIVVKLSK